MSSSRQNRNTPKKNSTIQMSAKNPIEKRQNRYVFGCIAMILYQMPCLTSLGLGIAVGKSMTDMILGMIVSVLSIPLGLAGLAFFKKRAGRRLMGLLCAVMSLAHMFCAFRLGGWYLIMLPLFVLILVCVSAISVLEK